MPKRTTDSDRANGFPWGTVIGGVAASALASTVVRRLPLGRLMVAAAALILAALNKDRNPRQR